MRTVVIFNPYCWWDFHANFEIPIYHNLTQRGYRVVYLRCGIDAEICDLYPVSVIPNRPANACNLCRNKTEITLNNAAVEFKSLSDYVDPAPVKEIENAIRSLDAVGLQQLELFGLNLHEITVSSLQTHFRTGQINPQDSSHLTAMRAFTILTARVLIAGKALLRETKPEAALIFNGRMAPTRAFLELCKQHGVKYSTHERGMARGSFRLNQQGHCLSLSNTEFIEQHLARHPLEGHQITLVRDWLQGRIKGKNQNWKNFLQNSSNHYADARPDKTRWVLFTSSADEIGSDPIFSSPFGDQYAWIMVTCALAEALDVELVIRVHPNSSGPNATGQNIEELEFFEKLSANKSYRNLSIIKSDHAVNSYDLAASADLILAYVSTIAIEALLMGKRVYLAANSPYSRCSGVHTPNNTPDYETFLTDHRNKFEFNQTDRENVVQAYRFMYHYVFKAHIYFPFVEQLDAHQNQLNVSNALDFDVGQYKELDHAVECILGKRQVMSVDSGYFSEGDLAREREHIFGGDLSDEEVHVSVVITNYNYATFLRSCVESVVAQKCDSIEIIIVDDGSSDNSREVIEDLLREYSDKNIRALYQENSGQPAIARNSGIETAQGKFILPLDADDMIAPGYLLSCIDIIERRPEVNLIYADAIFVYPNRDKHSHAGIFSPGRISKQNQIVVASLYSRALWEAVGGYKTNVRGYEDWDMWLNMSINGAIPAYYQGFGLIYNAKDTGVYQEAKVQHDKLYSQLVLNNPDAFLHQWEIVKWAREYAAGQEPDTTASS